jgi:hypothetical protein
MPSSITSWKRLFFDRKKKFFYVLLKNIVLFFFSRSLEYLLESGLLPFWLKRYTPNIDKCLVGKTKPQRRMMPFTLLDLSSAFLFLGIGVGLSFFTFLLEVMTQFKRKQQNKIRRVLVAQPLLL